MSNKYPNYLVLRALRITHGETQSECADRLAVTARTISNWETTRREALNERKMKRVYRDYGVTPQVAQTRTSEYLADIRKQGRPHPEDAAPTQPTKPHISRFASCRSEYPNTILGFGPKGGAVTLHGALDRLLRDQKPLFGFYCDALIRHIEGRRMPPEQDLYHPDHKPADTDGESLI